MGKKRSQKDRAYLTATEWKEEHGGYKGERRGKVTGRLPFHCCAISFLPFDDPVRSTGRAGGRDCSAVAMAGASGCCFCCVWGGGSRECGWGSRGVERAPGSLRCCTTEAPAGGRAPPAGASRAACGGAGSSFCWRARQQQQQQRRRRRQQGELSPGTSSWPPVRAGVPVPLMAGGGAGPREP